MTTDHKPDTEFVEYMENQVKNAFLSAATVMHMERVFIDQREKYEGNDTPAAKWRERGEADPHADYLKKKRLDLCMGNLTDDELANEMFLYDHRHGLSSMAYLTAAKERIRWLSRKLESHHRDLLAIHRVASHIAGVEPSTEDDTLTVKRVKQMAMLINQLSDGQAAREQEGDCHSEAAWLIADEHMRSYKVRSFPEGYTQRQKDQFSIECCVSELMHLLQGKGFFSAQSQGVPEGWRSQVEKALGLAKVFDDGGDGADGESAASVVSILAGLLSTPAAPQADEWVKCDDRLPSEADADIFGNVWCSGLWGSSDRGIAPINWRNVGKGDAGDTHWKPTGLIRPQPPEQEGQ